MRLGHHAGDGAAQARLGDDGAARLVEVELGPRPDAEQFGEPLVIHDDWAEPFSEYLDADEVIIVTDVEGVMTGDPRAVEGARNVGEITVDELRNLSFRGAEVVAVDISPALVAIAQDRLPGHLRGRVRFAAGDMLDADLGRFDHVVAQDSLIYYRDADIVAAVERLAARTSGSLAFTVAPRTALLMAMWRTGKLFPRSDRAPVMVPHAPERLAARLAQHTGARVADLGRVHSGFYISHALEVRP